VASLSKAWVCDCLLSGVSGSNIVGDMDDCLLCVLCVVRQRYLCRADHSPRGVTPPARKCMCVCVSDCD
jgi:hypothetical protein